MDVSCQKLPPTDFLSSVQICLMIDSFPLLKSLTPRETWEKVLLLKATRPATSWRLAAAGVARRGRGWLTPAAAARYSDCVIRWTISPLTKFNYILWILWIFRVQLVILLQESAYPNWKFQRSRWLRRGRVNNRCRNDRVTSRQLIYNILHHLLLETYV